MYDAAGAATAAATADQHEAGKDPSTAHHDGQSSGQGADHPVTPDVGPYGSKAEAQLEAASETSPEPITQIVFVDDRLPGIGDLNAPPGTEVVILDHTRDGITQVSEALAGRNGILTVHFVGHGEVGEFALGSTLVDSSTSAQRAADISSWSGSLDASADIMIWGCDVAASPAGQALTSGLAALTGADVAASSDKTGAAHRGGDWVLEVSTGDIDATTPFDSVTLAGWNHLLDPPDISTTGPDKITVAEPSDLNAPGADEASLGSWEFQSTAGGNVAVTATIDDPSIGIIRDDSGSGSAIVGGWSFTGTLAEANAWLDSLSFVAADAERGNSAATASITLTITDADGGNATESIDVEVTPANDATVLDDVETAVVEGSTNHVIDGSVLSPVDPEVVSGTQIPSQIVYRLTGNTAYGYLTLNGERIGVGSIFTQQDVNDGKLAYVHTATGANQNIADNFVVSINDGATPQSRSDSATVTLNITPVNQAPTAGGSGAVFEGQPANANTGGVPQSAVGSFIEASGGGDPGDDALSVTLTDLPDHGKLYFTGEATIGGLTQFLANHEITAQDIADGFVFDYADRSGLSYANDGLDGPTGRPPNDSFGVTITDRGGGTGSPASATATIDLTIRPVNDDPVWDQTSTQEATISPPTSNPATDYKVTLTEDMLNATDVDSAPENITFVVTSQTGLTHGRLIYVDGGTSYLMPEGATFSLADVKAGRIQYWQLAGAGPNATDTFNFQVVDNAVTPHWNPDGTSFERIGGIYTGGTSSDALQTFAFTINLQQTSAGADGSGLPTRTTTTAGSSSNYAGTEPSGGVSYGSLTEGGSVLLTDGSGGDPGLHYTADGIDPSQVVYTVLGFDGAGEQWNGQLQKLVNGVWETLGVYDTFTQADLNSGSIKFVHDGGEDFQSSVRLQASAGVLVSDGAGGLMADRWNTEFFFYVKPVNDAPIATGSSTNVINEGDTVAITTDLLNFTDADDADSESHLEGSGTLIDGTDNYAVNHDGSNPLTFIVTDLPDNGTLEYFDGTDWVEVDTSLEIDASWITNDPATTRLRYVHDGLEQRSDGFTVQATDRWNATSSPASVNFVITNLNDPPQIAGDPTEADPTGPLPGTATPGTGVNEPLIIVYEGSFAQIDKTMLQAIDPDSSAEQVQYRITSAPPHGRIAYSNDGITFTTIGVGSSFSQADVDNGKIYYLSNGDDPTSAGYPNAPDDKFVFTLADGAAEQTDREFWIYLEPTNDAPVVTAPSGPIPVTDTLTDIPGFSVSDPDLTALGPQETDFVQVVVRLLDSNGNPFGLSEYGDVSIIVTPGGATVDGTHDGTNDFLVLRGTREQVNDALGTLKVSFGDDRDEIYQVQVVADDRVRDAGGNFVDRDPDISGVQPGGNGGGTLNEPETVFTGEANPVPATEPDWYSFVVPSTGALAGNIAAASVTIHASSTNDPGTLGSSQNSATTYEDQVTPIGAAIDFQIGDAESEAFGTPITVTLGVGSGSLNVGTDPNVTVSGRDSGTLTLTGTAAAIETLLNSSLTYQSASNVNHDTNGGSDGDVTLTVSFNDTGSNLGSGQAASNPGNTSIALTIIPVNDAPTVSAGSGTIVLNGTTAVPGFSVGDADVDDPSGATDGETDFVQVTVRITDETGTPLTQAEHGDAVISSTNVPGGSFGIDSTYNGNGGALVIRGTQAEVNTYLAGLQVELSGDLSNTDGHYKVEVVADDRVRDAGGNLVGGANGGLNDASGNGTTAVPITAIDPYAAVPAGLTANVARNSRDVFPSDANDPAEVNIAPDAGAPEAGGTVQLNGITISDSDALDDDLTVTLTLENGFTIASVGGSTSDPSVGTNTVTITGTLAEINTAINSITVQLPDVPNEPGAGDWNGKFDVTIVVNDGGHNGGRPGTLDGDTNDSSANPGDFEYEDTAPAATNAALVTTRTFEFIVTPVNDAPQVIGGNTETLPAVSEDSDPTGTTVGDLFEDHFSDPLDPIPGGSTPNDFVAVAIVGLTPDAEQGTWQYHDGNGWVDVGARDASNALILHASTQIRFLPTADFHGTPESLTVKLVENGDGGDGSSPPGNGTEVDLSASGATGGTTRYSAGTIELSTSVTNVNDRPVIADATLPSIVEDVASPPGDTVGDLFGGTFDDANDDQTAVSGGGDAAGTLGGVAIIGNDVDPTEGSWQYSVDGGTSWADIPVSLSDSTALLLPSDAVIRFVPEADFNGTPGQLTVRGSDSPVLFSASTDISGAIGATGTWSAEKTLNTVVTPRNDAPVLTGSASNPTVVENGDTGTGTSIPDTRLVTPGTVDLSDLDLASTPGLNTGVFGAGTITVSLGSSYRPGDQLFIDGALPTNTTASDDGNGTLTITLDGGTTIAEVEALIEQIAYRNTSDNPTDFGNRTTRDYTITVADGNNDQAGGDAGGLTTLEADPIVGTITIIATNDPPIAVDDVNTIGEDDSSVSGNVITGGAGGAGEDTDPDASELIVTDVDGSPVTVGGTTVPGSDGGTFILHPDGTYTFVPGTDFQYLADGETATTSVTYTITDPEGDTDTATLTITITGSDDVLAAADDVNETDEDTAVGGNIVDGDSSGHGRDIDPEMLDIIVTEADGTPIAPGGTEIPGSHGGKFTIHPDGSYVFDPVGDFDFLGDGETATTAIIYEVRSADGDVDTATLTVTVTGRNDAPVLVTPARPVSGHEDGAITLSPSDFASTDADLGDTAVDVKFLTSSGGQLYLDGVPLAAGATVSMADIAAGKLTYRPSADGNGPSFGEVSFQVGDGTSYSATGQLDITVDPRNDTPTVGGPTSATVTKDGTLSFDGGNSVDHAPGISFDDLVDLSGTGATDSFSITLSVGHGVLTISDPSGAIGGEGTGDMLTLTGTRDALNAALATLTYRPNPDFTGSDQLIVLVDDHVNAGTGANAEPGTASHRVDIVVRNPPPADIPVDDDTSIEQPRGVVTSWDVYRPIITHYGDDSDLEGRPADRYTVTWQPISQQLIFKQTGDLMQGPLFYEARQGRDLPLPSWITFDPSTQTVTALPDASVKPGIYEVRVVARDAAGNEAESVLRIHVLQDVTTSLEQIREKAGLARDGLPRQPQFDDKSAPAGEDARNKDSSAHKPSEDAQEPPVSEGLQQFDNPARANADRNLRESIPAEVTSMRSEAAANEWKTNVSLTASLLNYGLPGQMVESARLLEALAADVHASH